MSLWPSGNYTDNFAENHTDLDYSVNFAENSFGTVHGNVHDGVSSDVVDGKVLVIVVVPLRVMLFLSEPYGSLLEMSARSSSPPGSPSAP